MNIILLLLNLILVLSCAAVALSLFDINRKSDYLLGVCIFSYANIVLILELSGLFSSITPLTVFCLQILFLIASIFVWRFNGRPVLLKPFKNLHYKDILSTVRKFPLLVLLAGGVTFVYLLYAQKVLIIPPNNSDSLTQHLSRIGYWLQYQSFFPWPTIKLSQTTFPMNAELGILWTILWWGTDQLAGFVQWMTVPVIMVGIYGLVRLLEYSRSQGMFTAFLWATLTQVLFQSSTTQNDLVVTSFWVVMIYFLFAGLKEQTRTNLYLSGIAFGLAVGTKSTSLINLPALSLVLLLVGLLYRKGKIFYPFFASWAISSLLAFLLLGSYIYIQNFTAFGNPLGPGVFSAPVIGARRQEDSLLTVYSHRLRDNMGRYIYQLVDFSPLPFNLAGKINPVKASFFSYIFNSLGVVVDNPYTIDRSMFTLDYINPFEENRSWFGPLMIFLIPAIIYQGVQGIRKRDVFRISLALFPIVIFAVQSTAINWTPARGRYFMTAVALSFPLISPLLDGTTIVRRLVRSFLVLLGLTSMLTIASYESDFRQIGWEQVLSGQRNVPVWEESFSYRMISENVPLDASMGVAFGKDTGDYPLFGERFTRKVTWVLPNEKLLPATDIEKFRRDFENSDFLFLSQYNPTAIQDAFSLLSRSGHHSLWIRKDLRSVNECDGNKWPFTEFYTSSSGSACPQFPVEIGIAATRTPNGDFAPEVGIAPDEYLKFGFLVEKKTEATFTISMYSGNIKSRQILQFIITGSDARSQVFTAPFNSANKRGVVNFVMPLTPDIYKIHLLISSGSVTSKIVKIQVTAK